MNLLVTIAIAVVLIYLGLLAALLAIRPRGNLLGEAVRLLPDVLRLLRRLPRARHPSILEQRGHPDRLAVEHGNPGSSALTFCGQPGGHPSLKGMIFGDRGAPDRAQPGKRGNVGAAGHSHHDIGHGIHYL